MSYRADKQVLTAHRRTDGRTDTQTQATSIPEGQNWPRVTIHYALFIHAKHKVSTIYIIHPDWHVTGHYSPSLCKICTSLSNLLSHYLSPPTSPPPPPPPPDSTRWPRPHPVLTLTVVPQRASRHWIALCLTSPLQTLNNKPTVTSHDQTV